MSLHKNKSNFHVVFLHVKYDECHLILALFISYCGTCALKMYRCPQDKKFSLTHTSNNKQALAIMT